MTYTSIYCTKEGIARRIRGRLNVKPNAYTNAPYVAAVPSYEVDDELVDQLIEQKENFLNLILIQMYELPLQNSHPVLTDIIESLVVAELLRVHFIGQGMQLAGDVSGAGVDLKNYAHSLLQMLTANLNIYIPGAPSPPTISGQQIPQPITLPGEIRRLNYQNNDLITNQATYIQRRSNDSISKVISDIIF